MRKHVASGQSRPRCVYRSSTRKVVAFAYGARLQTAQRKPEKTVRAFLDAWHNRLKLPNDPKSLREPERIVGPAGTHLLYQQHIDGRKTSRAWLRLDMDHEGNIVSFSNRLVPHAIADRTAEPASSERITGATAVRKAKMRFSKKSGTATEIAAPKLVFFRMGAKVFLCWKVKLQPLNSQDVFNIYIDAMSSQEISRESLTFHADGRGQVFVPNPMVALNSSALSPGDAIPLNAYQEVVLRDLDGSGFLNGPWVTTSATPVANRIRRISGDFRVSRGDRGFEEVMAYYHIDTAQRRLRDLALSTAAPTAIRVWVNGSSGNESTYNSQTKTIVLAAGGTPDAEDAEIILHEYAHALHDNIVYGFGRDRVSRFIAEGFADYFAASFFDHQKSPAFRLGIASWDARGEGKAGTPPFLRRLDNSDSFDINSRRLIEFWSSCLWSLRALFGPRKADYLAIAFLYYISPQASFYEAYLCLLAANQQLDHGVGERELTKLFRDRGLIL